METWKECMSDDMHENDEVKNSKRKDVQDQVMFGGVVFWESSYTGAFAEARRLDDDDDDEQLNN